ncbi:MAG: HD domain-containing protein [Clostridiales bacterium]|nr:HD domain-containing protein [Clostridiales bacterium]
MTDFISIENYMLENMRDSAHDQEHVYRVLNYALDIARSEQGVDYDVLVTACLLHDIGRAEQLENSALDHAEVGAIKAERWLLANGFAPEFSAQVCECIRSHRFRSNSQARSIEAKILFDADKVDVCGAIGIARTLFYGALVARPLYTLTNGVVSDGADNRDSVFGEYKFKLEKLYGRFHTARGAALAGSRQANAVSAYNNMLTEARECYANGKAERRRLGFILSKT